MAKCERQIRARAHELVKYLDEGIRSSGMSVELVDSSVQKAAGATVWLFVYDKYYMRASNRAALTVQVIGGDDYAYVTAIGAGGGNGALINFSYGAEEDFVGTVESLLDQYASI